VLGACGPLASQIKVKLTKAKAVADSQESILSC